MRVDAPLSQSQASSPTCKADSPSLILPKTSPYSSASSASKAEVWTVPSSPSSLDIASTAFLSMTGRHQQRSPVRCNGCIASPRARGRHRQRAPVLDIGYIDPSCSRPSNGPSCRSCSISSRGYYLRGHWRCRHSHRQPWPSRHRPRWCLCRLGLAVPNVQFFLCRGLHLSRGHRPRRLFRGHHCRRHRRT